MSTPAFSCRLVHSRIVNSRDFSAPDDDGGGGGDVVDVVGSVAKAGAHLPQNHRRETWCKH